MENDQMSDDKNNSEPDFDFDFDALSADAPQTDAEDDAFDLENPFGDDLAPLQSISESELNAKPFDMDSTVNFTAKESAEAETEETDESADSAIKEEEKADTKKKGWFSKGKSQSAKKESVKDKPKKEKAVKEKKPAGESMPRDWGTILCIAFSIFLLASLLMVNIFAFLTAGSSMMQTLCFLGAFNIVGLAAASVPILFYRFPKDRTLPNIMLGIAAVAMFCTVMFAVYEFYTYDFMLRP